MKCFCFMMQENERCDGDCRACKENYEDEMNYYNNFCDE